MLSEWRTQLSTIAGWWAAGRRVNPLTIDRGALSERWYHDFAPFGLPTPQLPGIYRPNQQSKAPVLFGYIDRAFAGLPAGAERSALEMFCADGFYALHAKRAGAAIARGVDIDEANIRKARLVADVLGFQGVTFAVADVFDTRDVFDVTICAGGLYHISEPEKLLTQMREQTRHCLVVQTVIHDGIEDPDYFETPAPGWTWGSRCSWARLLLMAEETGWRILDSHRDVLAGNERPEDRGTAFLLCEPH